MYRFSRAIYREVADDIVEPVVRSADDQSNHQRVLRACERTIERLAMDGRYFAKPSRSLFNEIRVYFPMCAQARVYRIVDRYISFAQVYLERRPCHGYDIAGNPLQCRATTRRGTPCARIPLPHNGYCPSHQHLVETEELTAAA